MFQYKQEKTERIVIQNTIKCKNNSDAGYFKFMF